MARLRPSYLCCVDKSNEAHFLRASRVCVTACRVVVSAQSSSRLSLTTWDNCWYWDDGCIPQGNRAINALFVCLHMCVAKLHEWCLHWCAQCLAYITFICDVTKIHLDYFGWKMSTCADCFSITLFPRFFLQSFLFAFHGCCCLHLHPAVVILD